MSMDDLPAVNLLSPPQKRPWAYWVLNENINTFLPRAVDTANSMRNDGDGDKYVTNSSPPLLF